MAKKVSIKKLHTGGKSLFLAYDQGLEHGPQDLVRGANKSAVDPRYIFEIAKHGGFHGLMVHKGIASQYAHHYPMVPLIIKLNGKTKLGTGDPYSPVICSVAYAKKLNAVAVGYTLYIGSEHEGRQLEEFRKIHEEAHALGLPVIVWMYPRGKSIKNDIAAHVLAYGARVGLEIGADMIKMKHNGKMKDLKMQIASAGNVPILIAGGEVQTEKSFLKSVKEMVDAGVTGFAVGRNIWKNKHPLVMTKKIKDIIFKT